MDQILLHFAVQSFAERGTGAGPPADSAREQKKSQDTPNPQSSPLGDAARSERRMGCARNVCRFFDFLFCTEGENSATT